ncbi:solute carrier family 39 (zinc transporter), member 1/2/3 [Enteropsectra breve]|nr:solute carrier family 39 (zinc transporter), member 1/2/3 [Enteropsectra breve]
MGPFIASGCIFILMLAVDVLFLHANHSHGKKTAKITLKEVAAKEEEKIEEAHEAQCLHECGHDHHHHDYHHDHKHESHGCSHHHHEHAHKHEHNHEHKHEHHHEHHSHEGHSHNFGTCNTGAISQTSSKLKAVVYLLAISAHSFFEGLAIYPAKFTNGAPFIIGICLHKVLESFSLGVSIIESTFSMLIKLSMLVLYSCLTPLGCLITAWMGNSEKFDNYQKWCNALSFGSLIYIVCVEMIGHSFMDHKNPRLKLLALTVGYGLGCALLKKFEH